MKMSRETPDLVKIGQTCQALCMKTYACFVASDKNSPYKHCCASLSIFILLTVICSWTVHTEWVLCFHCNSGYANTPWCYIVYIFTILLTFHTLFKAVRPANLLHGQFIAENTTLSSLYNKTTF